MASLPPDTSELVLRLFAAAVIGSGIGIDREVRGKPAGMRTHALVSLGAALCTVVVIGIAPPNIAHLDAVSRVIQGIIAGVGFLGAGAILKSPESVHGLTTAASIWFVAALGIACGTGQWIATFVAVALALLILIGGLAAEKIARRIFGPHEP